MQSDNKFLILIKNDLDIFITAVASIRHKDSLKLLKGGGGIPFLFKLSVNLSLVHRFSNDTARSRVIQLYVQDL